MDEAHAVLLRMYVLLAGRRLPGHAALLALHDTAEAVDRDTRTDASAAVMLVAAALLEARRWVDNGEPRDDADALIDRALSIAETANRLWFS